MRKTITLIATIAITSISFAQSGRVGINTETPKSTLDINGKKDSSGNLLNTDVTGMQAPRLTRAELTAKGDMLYGTDQTGTLVYITDITAGDALTQRVNITSTGYYYFDGSVWQKVPSAAGAGDFWKTLGNAGTDPAVNFLGTTDNKRLVFRTNNVERATLTELGDMGIGDNNPTYRLEMKSPSTSPTINQRTMGINDVPVVFLPDQATFTGSIAYGNGLRASSGAANNNTTVGIGSMLANTTGANNTSIGYNANSTNTTGSRNTSIGNQTLNANTAETDNTAVGHLALNKNTTSGSTAVGSEALSANTTGLRNTAVGFQALRTSTTANDNTAFGYAAANKLTTGIFNSAFGSNSLQNNTTGTFNTAIGPGALQINTIGSFNTAVGVSSLLFNNGYFNVAVGNNALFSNTSGQYNVAMGYEALKSNTTANSSVAIGRYALLSSNATGQIGIGDGALFTTSIGSNNVGVGTQTLYNNATGYNNTSLGNYTGYFQKVGRDNTLIGYRAMYTAADGNGSDANNFNTAVGSNALSARNLVTGTTAIGYNTGVTSGNYSTYLGYNAGRLYTSATNMVVIGADASSASQVITGLSNSVIIGANINLDGLSGFLYNNQIVLGDGSGNIRMRTDANGNTIWKPATKNTVANSTVEVNGSFSAKIRTLTTGTVADDDFTVIVKGDISLPAPQTYNTTSGISPGNVGRIYNLIAGDSTVRTVTGNFINLATGAAVSDIKLQANGNAVTPEYESVTIQSDGTYWYIISEKK